MEAVSVIRGNGPLILSQPHSGTWLPGEIIHQLTPLGQKLVDTDWHIPRLYDRLIDQVTIVRANFSRQLIDVNRDPGGGSLYPGQATTELVPLTTFDGESLWKKPPDEKEIQEYRLGFHTNYHQALANEINRVKTLHGEAIVYDCHSIRSRIPRFFNGTLPDLNIGTNSGASCAAEMSDAVLRLCQEHSSFSHVINGRFRGGWITRRYGQPNQGVHAVQMELAQCCYLDDESTPPAYGPETAQPIRALLRSILRTLQEFPFNPSSPNRNP